jgi:hypothetical protein
MISGILNILLSGLLIAAIVLAVVCGDYVLRSISPVPPPSGRFCAKPRLGRHPSGFT